jgi:hypothetical protein
MPTGATGQLGLALPVQGELSGTWGDTVNNGITQYVNVAIAGTLSFAGDGAITLANTTGDASASNIGSTTAQYMVIRITGALTTTKSITAPSYSKIYLVDNAATGGAVSFLRSGQATPVTIAAGESAFVYFNGTDYIKVTSDLILGGYTTTATAAGTTTLTAASTQNQFFTGSTTQTVVLPVAATLILGVAFSIHNNSTGDVTVNSSGGNLVTTVTPNTTVTFTCILTSGTSGASWDSDVTGFTTLLPVVHGGTGTSNPALVQGTGVTITGSWPNQTINATGTGGTVTGVNVSGGTTGLTTSGGPVTTSGTITLAGTLAVANGGTGVTSSTGTGSVVLSTSPTLVTPALGTPSSGTVTNLTGTASININGTVGATTPSTGAFTTLSATGNLTSLTAQFGTNPASVSVGVIGIQNQKRMYGRNTTNNGDINILFVDGNNNVVFGPNDNATFTSTSLGIGTSSPASNLHVVGNMRSSNGAGTIFSTLATDGVYATGTDLYLLAGTGYSTIIYANNSEKFRVGTAGQLGIGGATYGTAGQVLTSGGSSAAPTWAAAGGGGSAFVAFSTTGESVFASQGF